MDGISRSRGWDKEIPHGVLPMEQLVLSDKWARKKFPTRGMTLPIGTEACRGSGQQGHSEGWKLISRLDTHIRSFFLHTTTDFNLYLFFVIYFC